MTTRRNRNENANAEILGVVILIGIFAVTAGIISATTLSSPQPVKVPAASIEISNASMGMIRMAHNGGDSLAVNQLVLRGTHANGTSEYIDGSTNFSALKARLNLPPDKNALDNGYSQVITGSLTALVLTWNGDDGGESVIASWDPNGIYVPLGPAELGGGSIPGTPYVPRTQPPAPTPTPTGTPRSRASSRTSLPSTERPSWPASRSRSTTVRPATSRTGRGTSATAAPTGERLRTRSSPIRIRTAAASR